MALQPLAEGDLGTDVDTAWGIPLRWGLATGRKNLGNAIARRLSTPRGSLYYDPDYGEDIRGSINASSTLNEIADLQSRVTAQCELEERVQSADVTARFSLQTSSLRLDTVIEDADGPFNLILLVTGASVELFNGNEPSAPAAGAGTSGSEPTVINVGAPGPPGAPGVGSPGTGGGGGSIELPFAWLKSSSTGTEEVLDQQTCDFNNLVAGALTADLSGAGLSAAASAIARVYVGGSLGSVVGATLIGSVTISGGALALFTPMSVPFANPTGVRLVSITLQSSGAGVEARLSNPVVGFSS
jgi:hypothetical protein